MNMAIINFKSQTFLSRAHRLALLFIALLFIATFSIAGCGLTQTISDGTASLTKSIFL